eukprot:scaffold870_cov268-Pinguiococcus_pyrenoidosus.AAC.21
MQSEEQDDRGDQEEGSLRSASREEVPVQHESGCEEEQQRRQDQHRFEGQIAVQLAAPFIKSRRWYGQAHERPDNGNEAHDRHLKLLPLTAYAQKQRDLHCAGLGRRGRSDEIGNDGPAHAGVASVAVHIRSMAHALGQALRQIAQGTTGPDPLHERQIPAILLKTAQRTRAKDLQAVEDAEELQAGLLDGG